MKKRSILLLAALVLLLAGCGSDTETVPAEAPETIPATEVVELAEVTTEPTVPETTEPEIVDETVWLPVYCTEQGNPELHILVKNETMGNLSVESMQTVYYLGGEEIQQKEYDKNAMKAFLWRPFNELDLSIAASTLLIMDDYPSEDGFDHALVTVTNVDDRGTETVLTYNFTTDENEVTPSTLTDNWELSTSWLVETEGVNGWNWTCQPVNETDDVLKLEQVHHVNYDNGIPVAAGMRVPSQFSSYIASVEELAPGTSMPYTEGIMEQNRDYNQRETTYVYRDSDGQRHLQTFYFVYENALQEEEGLRFKWKLNQGIESKLPEGLFCLVNEDVDIATGKPQYSEAEIRKMIEDDLSLDEVAEKISTVADAFQYMNLKGFHYGMGQLLSFYVDGFRWEATRSSQSVFEYNQGACGDGTNLLNAILRDDYDEQGFVHQVDGKERHAFNWIKQDGVYYFVDWTLQNFTGDYDSLEIFVFATEDPEIYARYYVEKGLFSDETKYEIYLLYMYPREGDQYPYGIARQKKPFVRTLPSQIADSVMLLYEDTENCVLEFREGPHEELWPTAARNP